MADDTDFYEVLPNIEEAGGAAVLGASFTPGNGIRVEILNDDLEHWAVFDFYDLEQAEMIGRALIRWAARRRAAGLKI